MFQNWSHPQALCMHQTVSDTPLHLFVKLNTTLFQLTIMVMGTMYFDIQYASFCDFIPKCRNEYRSFN